MRVFSQRIKQKNWVDTSVLVLYPSRFNEPNADVWKEWFRCPKPCNCYPASYVRCHVFGVGIGDTSIMRSSFRTEWRLSGLQAAAMPLSSSVACGEVGFKGAPLGHLTCLSPHILFMNVGADVAFTKS